MEFKFKVGDVLTMRALLEPFRMGDLQFSPRVHVLERKSQECCGGTQLWYTCRCYHPSGSFGELRDINEIELCLVPVDEEERSAEWIDMGEKVRNAMNQLRELSKRLEVHIAGSEEVKK